MRPERPGVSPVEIVIAGRQSKRGDVSLHGCWFVFFFFLSVASLDAVHGAKQHNNRQAPDDQLSRKSVPGARARVRASR